MKKYVFYAVGEVMLVVIGILIALQIDDWNESRKERLLELTHLTNIKQDMEVEQKKLEEMILRRESKALSADIMNGYHRLRKINKLMDYYFHFINVMIVETHHPNNNSFKELINSGKLSLIKNDKIRLLLLETESDYNKLVDISNHLEEDNREYFFKNYAEIIDYEIAISVWADTTKSLKLSHKDVNRALQKRSIRNGYILAAFNNQLIVTLLKEILIKIKACTALIKEEEKK